MFDSDRDGNLLFEEFVKIFDVLIKGTEKEKNLFSFKLIDENESGDLSFEEFSNHFSKVI